MIALPCVDVKDRACIDECPVDCIYEGERSLYIHPDECVDCGACEPVCPVEAIFYEDDLPDGDVFWQAMNESEQWRLAEAKGRSYLLRDPGDWVWMWADALLAPGEDRGELAARLARL